MAAKRRQVFPYFYELRSFDSTCRRNSRGRPLPGRPILWTPASVPLRVGALQRPPLRLEHAVLLPDGDVEGEGHRRRRVWDGEC